MTIHECEEGKIGEKIKSEIFMQKVGTFSQKKKIKGTLFNFKTYSFTISGHSHKIIQQMEKHSLKKIY